MAIARSKSSIATGPRDVTLQRQSRGVEHRVLYFQYFAFSMSQWQKTRSPALPAHQ